MKPIDFNEDNLSEYFKKIIPRIKELKIKSFRVLKLAEGGNSAFVYPIECWIENGGRVKLFLKQTRNYAKVEIDIKIDPERVLFEQGAIDLFEKILGIDVVPHIYFVDKSNNLIIMSDIVKNSRFLVDELRLDNIHTETAKKFAGLFGKIHGQTFNDTTICFDQDYQKWLIGAIKEYNFCGAIKILGDSIIDKIINNSDSSYHSVIWGDAKPKNILIDDQDIRFFDLETVAFWDPAYDIGTFLCHWLLKIEEGKPKITKKCVKFINDFVIEYKFSMAKKVSDLEIKEIIMRSIEFIGVAILNRTDGNEPYSFTKETMDLSRQDAVRLIKGENEFLVKNGINFEV